MRTLLLVAALAALVLCGAAQTLSELANWNGTWYSGCNMQQQPPNVQRPGLDTFENRSYTFSGNDIFIDEVSHARPRPRSAGRRGSSGGEATIASSAPRVGRSVVRPPCR
jgi:hypothetical protein